MVVFILGIIFICCEYFYIYSFLMFYFIYARLWTFKRALFLWIKYLQEKSTSAAIVVEVLLSLLF